MKQAGISSVFLVLLMFTGASGQVRFVPAFEHLWFERPLRVAAPPDGTDRLFVVEQAGRVYAFPNRRDVKPDERTLVADMTDVVRSPSNPRDRGHNEEGLLGLAFDPKFADNGYVYLHYSRGNPRRGVISRFTMDADRQTIQRDSEKIILELEQPWGNHNGGMIEFGPDGYLYIAFGDGGAAGDPLNSGQDLSTLLGSILRIDVTSAPDEAGYRIPPDNPFVNKPGARGEIWAYGLRNAWRFSFDRKTGDLWAGDVGQNQYEEISLITKGGNFGWHVREGFHPYQGRSDEKLIDPIVEHDHREALSITGGYVYRGGDVPDMQGQYVYGDFVTGRIWAFKYERGKPMDHRQIGRVRNIASFGEDAAGELLVCSFDGRIYRMTP